MTIYCISNIYKKGEEFVLASCRAADFKTPEILSGGMKSYDIQPPQVAGSRHYS